MIAGIIIGTFIGGFFGVSLMCLLYYSREPESEISLRKTKESKTE